MICYRLVRYIRKYIRFIYQTVSAATAATPPAVRLHAWSMNRSVASMPGSPALERLELDAFVRGDVCHGFLEQRARSATHREREILEAGSGSRVR